MPKRALVWFVAALTLMMPVAVVAFEHSSHENSLTRHCDVCHVSHLPVVQDAMFVEAAPPARAEWRILLEELPHNVAPLLASRPSRAPPAA